MSPYKDQGIVLRSYKLGEADRIVTVMTQGAGKVRAVAEGIRKTKSRFGARLERSHPPDLLSGKQGLALALTGPGSRVMGCDAAGVEAGTVLRRQGLL